MANLHWWNAFFFRFNRIDKRLIPIQNICRFDDIREYIIDQLIVHGGTSRHGNTLHMRVFRGHRWRYHQPIVFWIFLKHIYIEQGGSFKYRIYIVQKFFISSMEIMLPKML